MDNHGYPLGSLENGDQRMSVMYLLILLSLILASGFVIAFVWAIRSGQYDDKYTPSVRVLFDDHPVDDNMDQSTAPDVHSAGDNQDQSTGSDDDSNKELTGKSAGDNVKEDKPKVEHHKSTSENTPSKDEKNMSDNKKNL